MKTKAKTGFCLVVVLYASALMAAYKTFQNAGGDIASTETADWGGAAPGTSDTVIVDQAGTYTLSGDVEFNVFTVKNGGETFNFTGRTLKTNKNGESLTCAPVEGHPVVFNGGVITNTTSGGRFYATKNCSNSKTEIKGGAKAYTARLDVQNGTGTDNVLEISGGGQVYVSDYLYSDVGGTDGTYGGQTLRVSGSGSLLKYTANRDVSWGFKQSGNTLHVTDGADFISTAPANRTFYLGSANIADVTNNAIFVDRSATATIPNVVSRTSGNRIFVGDGGTLTVPTLKLDSGANEIVVSDATFNCSTAFNLGSSASSVGNVFRAIGPDVSLTLTTTLEDMFANGYGNMFSLEGGFVWNKGINTFCTNTHHCVFRVSGEGTIFGDATSFNNFFYFGSVESSAPVTDVCASNSLEVLDGAVFNARRIALMGVGNALVVSNATVRMKNSDDGIGMRVGYTKAGATSSTGCMVRLCGYNPKIDIDEPGSIAFANNSVLRFEIPRGGWGKNHVAISTTGTFNFDSGCRLEIDCGEFFKSGGGTVVLIESGMDISASAAANLLANVSGLPEGGTIIVSGHTVKLRCPRKEFVVSFR